MKTKAGVLLKPIPIAPNQDYMAGEDGLVYSRTKYAGFGRKDYVDWYSLTGHLTGNGYLSISMCHKNKKVTANIHRLICMAFHGQPTSMSHQVRHLDGNPSNNLPSNLQWGTQAENWHDRRSHGTASVGEKHWNAKLTDVERSHIRWAVEKGLCSQRQAARALGMTQGAISALVNTK